jgi:hypothetical protein
MAMLTDQFDAYGEVLPGASCDQHEATKTASAVLSRIGHYVFWLFVVIIIATRVIYYPATPASAFVSTGQPSHSVTR